MKAVKVKGTAVLSTRRYLTERFGKAAWPAVLAGLAPDERARLGDQLRESERYPYSLFLKALRRAQDIFRHQEPRLHEVLGRASVDHAGAYKVFFRIGSPKFIIAHVSEIWDTHFNHGEMRTVLSEKRRAVVELADFPEPTPELCERISGWFVRALELAGAKEIRLVHTQCVNQGGKVCRYEGSWS